MVRMAPLSLVTLALVACQGASDDEDQSQAPRNLGLAARGLVGQDELWLVRVSEAEQGGLDRNGDGDAADEVVVVLDLEKELVLDPGLALADTDGPVPLLACDGQCAAFAVDEAASGGRDLNGDGDALDRVLHVYEPGRDLVELGLAVSAIEVGGALVACAVDEQGQSASDLDADGDADGSVLAVHDLRDGSTTVFSLRDSAPLLVRDERVALRVAEREGLDLNLDGDDDDQAVFELYDARTRLLQNTTLVLAGPGLASAAGTFGLSVDERGQGRGDLSGDGDSDDAVFHVFDPERGLSVNLGVSIPFHPPPAVDGQRYLLLVREEPSALDRNGDGDLEDLVVHVFDAATGLLSNAALATQGSARLAGGWVGVSVSEAMQGSTDLDGDGEAGGNVVHAFELDTGSLQNLELDAFEFLASSGHLFLAPFEELAAVDWNDDGDQSDRVLFGWSAADGRTRNLASVWDVLAVQGEHALVSARESDRGGDGNGDGDADDLLLELFDANLQRSRPLGLAQGRAQRLTAQLAVLALVEEAAQGRDLNGDGDLADDVLHASRPRR